MIEPKSKGVIGRREVMKGGAAFGVLSSLQGAALAHPSAGRTSVASPSSPAALGDDREYWVQLLTGVAEPVLQALSERKLKTTMPVEVPHGNPEGRAPYTHLEALGRLMAGIAPWLESGAGSGTEGRLRQRYAEWARTAIQAGTDPKSPDFMNFNKGS